MSMKLLQWNILYLDSIDKIDDIIKELKKFDADIVCLQEVSETYNSNTIDKLLKSYKYSEFAYADEKKLENRIQGNAILSKYPIIEKKEHLISPRHDYENNIKREGRVYLEVDILLPSNEKITVSTVHNSLYKKHRPRGAELDITLALISKHTKRFIFAGDLNSTPDDPYVKNIQKYLCHSGPSMEEKTCTTKPRTFDDGSKEPYLNLRIDYVFNTPDIKILDSKIIKTQMSDHLPIMTKFKIT